MIFLVDTSVWSLALRRDAPPETAQVQALKHARSSAEVIVTIELVLQELLQGFAGAKAGMRIIERIASLAWTQPDREDHIAAASLRNACRRGGGADWHRRRLAPSTR